MNLENISLINFCKSITEMIDVDVEKAESLYNEIFKLYNTEDYKLELECLKNMIIEKKDYLKLSCEKRKQYDDLKQKGKVAYMELSLEESLYYYMTALEVTNHNIFNYYIGKIYYKLGSLEESLFYLELYKENGGEKLSKCLLYLSKIYIYNRKFKKKDEYEHNIIRLTKFFQHDFKFRRKINTLAEQHNGEDNAINDETKIVDLNVKEKLIVIRNMMVCKQYQAAEKKLRELEKLQSNMTVEDKEMLQQFQKNKKLYRAKR